MKYYASYKPETGKTHIVAYDEAKHGASRETAHAPSHTAAMPPAREVKSKNSE